MWPNSTEIRLAQTATAAQIRGVDNDETDADLLFLDAVNTIVLDALARIGSDPEARFRFFRRLVDAARIACSRTQGEARAN